MRRRKYDSQPKKAVSSHVILVLRFYCWLLNHLGLVNMQRATGDGPHWRFICREGNDWMRKLQLSLTFFMILLCVYAIYNNTIAHLFSEISIMLLFITQLVVLLRRRAVVLRELRLLNRFLELMQRLHALTSRPLRLSLLITVQVLLRFLAVGSFIFRPLMMTKSTDDPSITDQIMFCTVKVFVIAELSISFVGKEITNHISCIALTVLKHAYAELNLELEITAVTLKQTMRLQDAAVTQTLNLKMQALRQLYGDLWHLSTALMRCIQLRLALLCLYNVAILLATTFVEQLPSKSVGGSRSPTGSLSAKCCATIFLCLNNMRQLCSAFEDITIMARAQHHFDEENNQRNILQLLGEGYGMSLLLAQATASMNCTAAQYDGRERYLQRKDHFLAVLMQPTFTFFHMVPINRKLFFKLLFSYFSFLYLYHETFGRA